MSTITLDDIRWDGDNVEVHTQFPTTEASAITTKIVGSLTDSGELKGTLTYGDKEETGNDPIVLPIVGQPMQAEETRGGGGRTIAARGEKPGVAEFERRGSRCVAACAKVMRCHHRACAVAQVGPRRQTPKGAGVWAPCPHRDLVADTRASTPRRGTNREPRSPRSAVPDFHHGLLELARFPRSSRSRHRLS